MVLKKTTIAGKPLVLFIDTTRNAAGWEHQLSQRIFSSIERRGVAVLGDGPYHISSPEEMAEVFQRHSDFNCLLLQAHGDSGSGNMQECWEWLSSQGNLGPKLFAASVCGGHPHALAERVLQSQGFASIAVVPVEQLLARQAAPFFVKFFVELDLHTKDSISSIMAQFAFAKAQKFAQGKMKIRF